MATESTLQDYLDELLPLATKLGYLMKISGTNPAVFRERDARTLKISWPDDQSSFVLELEESRGKVRIFRHKSSDLTGRYRYRAVSLGWVSKFLNANLGSKPEHTFADPTRPAPFPSTKARKTGGQCYHCFGACVMNGRTCSICGGRGYV